MIAGIVEDYSVEKFKDKLESELNQLSKGTSNIDVKFSTCVTDKGILYSALIISG